MIHEFELSYNTAEATKNICCAKGKGTVEQNTVTLWFNKFGSDEKHLDDQAESRLWSKT